MPGSSTQTVSLNIREHVWESADERFTNAVPIHGRRLTSTKAGANLRDASAAFQDVRYFGYRRKESQSMHPRVCFVTNEYHPDIGGLGKSSRRIARFLSEHYAIELIAPTPTIPAGELITSMEDGYRVHRLGKGVENRLLNESMRDALDGTMARIRRLITRLDEESPFDLFHAFFLPCALPCLAISRGRPVIASIRGNDAVAWREASDWTSTIDRIVDESTWVTTVASDLLRRFERGERGDRCSFIPNSIDTDRHPFQWNLERGRGVVGTLANLREKKNIPLLLSGYSGVPKSIRSELLVVGGFEHEPALKDRLDALADDLDIASELTLFGQAPPREVQALYRRMHVFAFTSDHDGMPNSMLEAAACGVPIVATTVGAIPDVMVDERDGLLVPPGDPKALAEALTRVLSDDELATRLSLAARKLAERFSPAAERARWLSLYDDLLLDSARARRLPVSRSAKS